MRSNERQPPQRFDIKQPFIRKRGDGDPRQVDPASRVAAKGATPAKRSPGATGSKAP